MPFLNNNGKGRVTEAIAAAEQRTSGEFVAVLAQASSDYLVFPALWAAIAALVTPGAILIAGANFGLLETYAIQVAVFLVVGAFCLWPPVRIRLVPKAIRHARASRAAHEQFYLRDVHRTQERSGVLLFVSSAERYVEIVADEGIHAKVGEERWQEIIDVFVSEVKSGQTAAGFENAVAAIGDAMAAHYPRASDDVNELPNHLVEL